MLTKRDLELISLLLDAKLEAKFESKLSPIHIAIHGIKEDIHGLKADVQGLKADVSSLKNQVISVNNRLDKNTTDLVDLITTGSNSFEPRV